MSSPELPIPPDVRDSESAEAFVRWCVEHVGLGYHPDTPFEDYVDADGSPSFSSEAARSLNERNARAFDNCDPYEFGLCEVRRKLRNDGIL